MRRWWAAGLGVFLTSCGGATVASSGDDATSLHACSPLAASVTAEYDATAADGTRLFVIHPATTSYGYEDFRIFYGAPNAMLERKVVSVTREKSGRTFMSFMVDGVQYEATIASAFDNPGFQTSTLAFSGQSEALVVAETNSAGSGVGLSFQCL